MNQSAYIIDVMTTEQAHFHLLNFFSEVVEAQKTIQKVRIKLQSAKGWHPAVIWRALTTNGEGISISRMRDWLKAKTACNSRQLYDLFERFDHSRNGYICLTDFSRELLPAGKKIPKQNRNSLFSFECEKIFISLLNVMIKSCRVLDQWRKELQPALPYELFASLNQSQTGSIGPHELLKFYLRNGRQLSTPDCQLLFLSLLRRHHTQLNLQVFCQNLMPLEFGGYQAYQIKLQQQIKAERLQKEARCIEAKQAEYQFHKQRRNEIVIQQIHKSAALTRQQQLQCRIKDQIDTYNQLKYLAKKKYHPTLQYQQFLIMEKENIERNRIKLQILAEQQMKKDEIYRKKIQHADQVMAVECFKLKKSKFKDRSPLSEISLLSEMSFAPSTVGSRSQLELEQRIRSHKMNQLNHTSGHYRPRRQSFENTFRML